MKNILKKGIAVYFSMSVPTSISFLVGYYYANQIVMVVSISIMVCLMLGLVLHSNALESKSRKMPTSMIIFLGIGFGIYLVGMWYGLFVGLDA